MKDEEAIDWRERFQYFHWTRGTDFNISIGQGEQAQGKVKEAYQERGVGVFLFKEEGGE